MSVVCFNRSSILKRKQFFMLRRSTAFVAEAAEMSTLMFAQYVGSSLCSSDFLGALLSVDQALFSVGLRKPLTLFYVFQSALSARIAQRLCESVVAGTFLCGPAFFSDAAMHFITQNVWQELMFQQSYPVRFLQHITRWLVPRPLRSAFHTFSDTMSSSNEEFAAESEYAINFRTSIGAEHSSLYAVFAANAVTDCAFVLADQCQWVAIYAKEVLVPWFRKTNKLPCGAYFRRTLRSHLASTALSVMEASGHLSARLVGRVVAARLFGKSRYAPAFWIEAALVCLGAPIIEAAARYVAAQTFRLLELALPTTEAEASADAEEHAQMHEEEETHREQYFAATNKNDLYAVLGVDSSAKEPDIKKAYRQKALQYHPDRVSHLPQEEKVLAQQAMASINEAYEVLSCDSKRSAYDACRTAAAVGFDPENPPQAIQRFLLLPMYVQVPLGIGALAGCLWVGGIVFYGHLKSYFVALTGPGRGPLRSVCQPR